MGDHFVLFVDRLITESTIEAAIESRQRIQTGNPSVSTLQGTATDFHSEGESHGNLSPSWKLVECRICQDEDEDSKMEIPCSCRGSLKYAHRKCVQRWCNEKGDTTCEICHQQFKPGYTAAPRLFHCGGIPMHFRGNWEITRRDLNNPQFIAMVAADRDFLDVDVDDSVASSRSLFYCRFLAAIFTLLFILQHILPLVTGAPEAYPLDLLMSVLVRAAGIVMPIYIIARIISSFLQRRQHQEPLRH